MDDEIKKGDQFRDAPTGRVFEALHDAGGFQAQVRVVAHPAQPDRVGAWHSVPSHWLREMERVRG